MPTSKTSRIDNQKEVAHFIAKTIVQKNDDIDPESLAELYNSSFEKALNKINELTNPRNS